MGKSNDAFKAFLATLFNRKSDSKTVEEARKAVLAEYASQGVTAGQKGAGIDVGTTGSDDLIRALMATIQDGSARPDPKNMWVPAAFPATNTRLKSLPQSRYNYSPGALALRIWDSYGGRANEPTTMQPVNTVTTYNVVQTLSETAGYGRFSEGVYVEQSIGDVVWKEGQLTIAHTAAGRAGSGTGGAQFSMTGIKIDVAKENQQDRRISAAAFILYSLQINNWRISRSSIQNSRYPALYTGGVGIQESNTVTWTAGPGSGQVQSTDWLLENDLCMAALVALIAAAHGNMTLLDEYEARCK